MTDFCPKCGGLGYLPPIQYGNASHPCATCFGSGFVSPGSTVPPTSLSAKLAQSAHTYKKNVLHRDGEKLFHFLGDVFGPVPSKATEWTNKRLENIHRMRQVTMQRKAMGACTGVPASTRVCVKCGGKMRPNTHMRIFACTTCKDILVPVLNFQQTGE